MMQDTAREQLAQWEATGHWTARHATVCRWLAEVPMAVTSQLAWGVMEGTTQTRLKEARAVMRDLRRRGVVEHRRLKYRDEPGRPEDGYRLVPGWAAALGYGLMPMDEDWARDWLRADVRADAAFKQLDFAWNPPGRSHADWVRTYIGARNHVHAYGYILATATDLERYVDAISGYQVTAIQPHCRVGRCGVWFEGWDLERSLNPAARSRGWSTLVKEALGQRPDRQPWSVQAWMSVKVRLAESGSMPSWTPPTFAQLAFTAAGETPPTF